MDSDYFTVLAINQTIETLQEGLGADICLQLSEAYERVRQALQTEFYHIIMIEASNSQSEVLNFTRQIREDHSLQTLQPFIVYYVDFEHKLIE